MTIFWFLSVFFCGLAMAPALAHLFELPNKILLSREDYFVTQQIYRGWALMGVYVLGAMLSTLGLTLLNRKRQQSYLLPLFAFLCIVGTQIVFWSLTFPMNQLTANWTVVPADWQAARARWEYSHAASAVLNVIAFAALSLDLARREGWRLEAKDNQATGAARRTQRAA